jgi:hypothetical protein
MYSSAEILGVLDGAAEAFVLPMLDNGYVYLAATRLSLFRSPEDWAIVMEVFGYSPRAGLPDLGIWTFASRLRDRSPPEQHGSSGARDAPLRQQSKDDARFFWPIQPGPWQDAESDGLVAEEVTQVLLRDHAVDVPSPNDMAALGIELSERPRLCVFELCRFLAATYREQVLATAAERSVSVPAGVAEMLRLDEWNHPDLAASEVPSRHETFAQLARVLETGDVGEYRPTREPNTHWRHWPDGGTL